MEHQPQRESHRHIAETGQVDQYAEVIVALNLNYYFRLILNSRLIQRLSNKVENVWSRVLIVCKKIHEPDLPFQVTFNYERDKEENG